MEGMIEYTKEEVEEIVLSYHSKLMPAPDGMVWIAVFRVYSGIKCELIKEVSK